MNRQDLIDQIADGADISKKAAQKALESFLEAVTLALRDGEEVALVGFGSFVTSKRAARSARNPRTGEVIHIPESVVARFKPGKKLRDAVRKS